MRTVDCDVLVVGSGFGAAAPALRLAEAGLRVTVIEKGPRLNPFTDFRQTQDPRYVRKYLKSLAGDHLSVTYAEALGGGSGFYEMVSLRAPTGVFRQTATDGTRLWPAGLDRAALDPWYDVAERMLHVEQIAPGDVPASGLVFSRMMHNLGYSCDRARYAVKGCLGSGFCVTGCIYAAKQSLLLNYLPQAVAAGVTIDTDVEAVSLRTLCEVRQTASLRLADLPVRYELLCRTRTDSAEWLRYRARIVILGGGTVGTATLLLRSRKDLARLSDQVGRNIAFNGGVKVAGILPENAPGGDMFAGRSHPGMISYEFLDSHGITISAAKPLPLQVIASARLRLDGDPREPAYWGASHVELMQLYRKRMMVLVSFGMTPPLGELRPVGDGFALGLPLTAELRSYHDETEDLLKSILRRNGCRLVEAEFVNGSGAALDDLHFSTAHHVGSARMADTPAGGVVDAAGEVFGYPGLYVSDGAAIPSSLAVNTSLTILANAERIAAGIVQRHMGPATIASVSDLDDLPHISRPMR